MTTDRIDQLLAEGQNIYRGAGQYETSEDRDHHLNVIREAVNIALQEQAEQ